MYLAFPLTLLIYPCVHNISKQNFSDLLKLYSQFLFLNCWTAVLFSVSFVIKSHGMCLCLNLCLPLMITLGGFSGVLLLGQRVAKL